MAVEGFIFFPSYMEAAECLDEGDQLRFLRGLIQYGLTGEDPGFTGAMKGIFVIARRNIDASNTNRANGAKRSESKKGASAPSEGGFRTPGRGLPKVKKGASVPSEGVFDTSKSPLVYDIDIDSNIDMDIDMDIDEPPSSAPAKKGDELFGQSEQLTTPSAPAQDGTDPMMPLADNVSMKRSEYRALVSKYGEKDTKAMIEKLDAYKAATGKKYASDYSAILSWVVTWLNEEKQRRKKAPPAFEGGTDATAAADNQAATWMREFLEKEGGP